MAAITDLSTASSVAAADYLVLSQSGTDKKVTADKLAIVGLANTFAALQTMTSGIGIGGTANKITKVSTGIVAVNLEWLVLASNGIAYISTTHAGRGLVAVYSATHAIWSLIAVEGGNGNIIYGNTGIFSGSNTANRIVVQGDATNVYVLNKLVSSVTISCFALLS